MNQMKKIKPKNDHTEEKNYDNSKKNFSSSEIEKEKKNRRLFGKNFSEKRSKVRLILCKCICTCYACQMVSIKFYFLNICELQKFF